MTEKRNASAYVRYRVCPDCQTTDCRHCICLGLVCSNPSQITVCECARVFVCVDVCDMCVGRWAGGINMKAEKNSLKISKNLESDVSGNGGKKLEKSL